MHERCTALSYPDRTQRTCQLNITEAVAPYGILERDVPFDTMNMFMDVSLTPEGQYVFQRSRSAKGNYVEFWAEVDLLVAVSNCPNNGFLNNFSNKPLAVEIYS